MTVENIYETANICHMDIRSVWRIQNTARLKGTFNLQVPWRRAGTFSVLQNVQTYLEAHLASYSMGSTSVSKVARWVSWLLNSSSWKCWVELLLCSPYAFMAWTKTILPLPFTTSVLICSSLYLGRKMAVPCFFHIKVIFTSINLKMVSGGK